MAETKQEKKTFKWGDSEYLLDDLLKLHAEQEQNFYNFAKVRGQYDDNALAGLRAAISSRIGAVKDGKSFDADGVLDTDKVDNVSIQTQKKGLFKKDKYVDQDNTEWAKYYLNKLVGGLKPHQKEEIKDTGKWDINKHGLAAYLSGQGYNAQDIFEKYDLRDENNPDAARSYAQRDAQLRKHLVDYKTWLENKGFDFTKNDNEWDDNYMSTLDSVINGDWTDRTALAASLRKLGSGNYAIAFTSDKWDLSKSDEELTAESKQRKEQEAARIKSEHMKKAQDTFLNNYKEEKGSYLNFADYTNHNFGKGVTPSFMNYYANLNKDQQKPYGTYLGTSSESWDKAYQTLMQSLRDGVSYTDNNKGIILQRYFEDAPNGFTDVGDGLYLVNESVNDMGEGYVYDPVSKYFQKRHISEFANQNSNIKKLYEDLLYDYINKTYGTNYDTRTYVSFKEGGVLKAQLGAAVLRPYNVNEQYKEKSSESGLDVETQKARDRYINSDNKSEANPDAGFSTAEITRLITIGADIGSIFLDPISGTAVGLASSAGNFAADIMDDGFQLQDVGNLAVNVGFDLLGAIPIFGDAVGTGGKIAKNLLKFGPRIMTVLATYQGVKNFDGMMGSWEKMLSSDKDAKMTVQDWRNIAQSISLVTGAGRAIKNKAAQNAMKNKARVDDVVGINIYDKSTKQTRQILVDGETAKNIKAAQGDRAKVEAELSKLEDFKDKFGASGTLEVLTKGHGPLQSPIHRATKADGSKSFELRPMRGEGRAQVTDVYDFSRVPEGYGRFWGKQPEWGENLAKWHKDKMEQLNKNITPSQESHLGAKTAYDAEIERLMGPVNDQIQATQAAMARRTQGLDQLQRQTSRTVSEITKLQKRLRGVKEADVQAELAGFNKSTAGLQSLTVEHARMTQKVDNLTAQLNDVKQKIALEKSMNRKTSHLEQQQAQIESQLQASQTSLTAMEAQISTLQAQGANRSSKEPQLKQTLRDFEQLRMLERRLNNLKESSKTAATTNHTSAYNKLQQMVQDLQTNHAKVEGRDVTWDLNKILQDAGVQNAFKQGGSINRNKINKFLNYAKG